MGLDMYLYRSNKERADEWKELSNEEQRERTNDNPWTQVAYWRKANMVRQWFVDNCGYPEDGNCEEVEVTEDDLLKLINDCKDALSDLKNADSVMPVSNGFFFGSQAYDEWYVDDLRQTIKMCEEILESTDFKDEVIKYTDWW